MSTDNPTSPKGTGGPPTEPGWYWARSIVGVAWAPTEVKRVEGGAALEAYWWDEPCPVHDLQWRGARIVLPESEPAPPTDGPTESLAEEVSRMVHAFSDDGRRLAVRDLAHRVGTALAESRAEVERLRAEADGVHAWHAEAESLQRKVDQLRVAVKSNFDEGVEEAERITDEADAICSALRDRVRVLEAAIRDACYAGDCPDRLRRALATTQEPPAKEPT